MMVYLLGQEEDQPKGTQQKRMQEERKSLNRPGRQIYANMKLSRPLQISSRYLKYRVERAPIGRARKSWSWGQRGQVNVLKGVSGTSFLMVELEIFIYLFMNIPSWLKPTILT
jgi:hypothetical protein